MNKLLAQATADKTTTVTFPETPVPGAPLKSIDSWVTEIFPTLVMVISAFAVLAIAYWGAKYILSNIPGQKAASTDRMWSALLGLLLALASVLILKTINPNIGATLSTFLK